MTQQMAYDKLVAAQDITFYNLVIALRALQEVQHYFPELGYQALEISFMIGYLRNKKEQVKGLDIGAALGEVNL